MKKYILLIIILTTSIACGVSIDLFPTSTPTLIPFSQLDIQSLLVQPGDLPPGYSGAQILDSTGYAGINSSQSLTQELALDDEVAGAVLVYLYESTEEVNRVFNILDTNLSQFAIKREEVTIGEDGLLFTTDYQPDDYNRDLDIAFTRCHALIWIRFFQAKPEIQPEDIQLYANRLDKRLQNIVCR